MKAFDDTELSKYLSKILLRSVLNCCDHTELMSQDLTDLLTDGLQELLELLSASKNGKISPLGNQT